MTPTQAAKLRQLITRYGAQLIIDPSLGTTAALSPAEQLGGELSAFIDECTGHSTANLAFEQAAKHCDGLAKLFFLPVPFDRGYTMAAERAATDLRNMKTGSWPLAAVDTSSISQVEPRSDLSVLVHFITTSAADKFIQELK